MNEEWSNDACRGYVIKAMENCGFHVKDIHQVLVERGVTPLKLAGVKAFESGAVWLRYDVKHL